MTNTAQAAAAPAVRQNNGARVRITDKLLAETTQRISAGQLVLPPDYSLENALASAYLELQSTVDKNGQPALKVCTELSICQSLRDMLYMGLNPAKKQCWFIVRGNELTLMRSYFGNVMLAKRLSRGTKKPIADITAQVVYEGEIPEIDTSGGYDVLVSHKRNPFAKHTTNEIIGAYANIIYEDGSSRVVTMTIDEIHRCWDVGHAQRNSPAHKNTPEQMIMRTVINRACKPIINQSDDRTLLGQVIRENEMQAAKAERDDEVRSHTNVIDVVDFEPAPMQRMPESSPAQIAPSETNTAIQRAPMVDMATGEVMEMAQPEMPEPALEPAPVLDYSDIPF